MTEGQFHLSLIVPSQHLHTTGLGRLEDDQKKSETPRSTKRKRKAAVTAVNRITHLVEGEDEGDDESEYSEH